MSFWPAAMLTNTSGTPINPATSSQLPAGLGAQTTANSVAVTVASDQTVSVNQAAPASDRTGNGTMAAVNAVVTVNSQGCSTVTMYITGTFLATYIWEASNDGSNWVGVYAFSMNAFAQVTNSTASAQSYAVGCGGYTFVRIRALAWTSGTITVAYAAGVGSNITQVINMAATNFLTKAQLQDNAGAAITVGSKTSAASLPVVIASDQGALSLPTGAATSALQTTGNTSLTTLAANLPAKGVAVSAASTPVTVASDQAPIPIYATDSIKATYSATANFTAAATPTDVFTLSGSASKLITITAIYMSATQTTAGTMGVYLIKRSAANTGGTSATPTAVPYDSNDAAASAVARNYTANATALGTAVGTIAIQRLAVLAAATANSDRLGMLFGGTIGKGIVLRGVAQTLAVNLNSVTYTGNSLYITVEWTEE